MMSQSSDPWRFAHTALCAGREVVLARVVRTWGSAPCPVGSAMAVDADGGIAGSVSGGCVEAAVADGAREVLAGGRARLLSFRVGQAMAHAAGLACGGEMAVWVERAEIALVEAVLQARADRTALTLVTDLEGAEPTRVGKAEGARWFVHALPPQVRVLMIGGVHVAQHLAPLALASGFAATVIDPRDAMATPERFPGVSCSDLWPEEALEAFGCDDATAVIALAHDPVLDDPALARGLAGEAFYVGALGSRRSHAARCVRLAEEYGLGAEALARLRGPVGLAIGAVGPAEIAVSILGEIIAVRRGAVLAGRQGW